MVINFGKILPLALMSEHRETGASITKETGGDSYHSPEECVLDTFLPQANIGIIPQLDIKIKAELAKVACNSKTVIKLTGLEVPNKTFAIGDIVFYFQKDVKGYNDATVSIEISLENVQGDKAVLRSAVYRFSSPVLAGTNLEFDPKESLSLGCVYRALVGQFNAQDVLNMLNGMSVSKYDKTSVGTPTNPVVPTMIAFDEITVSSENGLPAVRFALRNKKCIEKGWGQFSLGVSRDGCVTSKNDDAPGEFLGNGWAGGKEDDPVGANECRSVEMGARTRMAFMMWMINSRKDSYDSFLKQSSQNSAAAMVFLLNEFMGIKAKNAPDSWKKLAKEQYVLGGGYLLWRTQTAKQK